LPIYEYKCEGCGETFEKIQKFADEPLTVHETCGGVVHRLMSAPAFQFKGTGWYVTDYAKGNVSGPPKHESGKHESGSDSGKSESGGSESGKSDGGKSDGGKSDSSSKTSTETATKSESKSDSKPAASSSSKND
jgi:putative FmdB family regulatory protein